MSMPTDTIVINPNRAVATQLVAAGDGPTLIVNSDLENTVYLGNNDGIHAGDPNGVVPLGPNGSVSVDGKLDFYGVIANTSTPVTVYTIAGGTSNFLGITQGGGNLAISSIQSPNFDLSNPSASPNPSWGILKNGLAYFVGLTLTGGTLIGPDYIIDPTGVYFYSGTPALGNLVGSWVPSASTVTDPKGNAVFQDITVYGPNSCNVRLSSTGGFSGSAGLLLHPQNATHLTILSQVVSNIVNAGAVNEQEGITISSGKSTTSDDASIQLYSESADGTILATHFLEVGGVAIESTNKTGKAFNVPVTANSGTTASPTNITSDTWHEATAFNNGWTAQNAGFWYRMTNDKELEILGDLSGGPAGNSSIITFTGAYVPNLSQNHPCGQNNPGGTSPPWIYLNNAGVLSAIGVPVAGEEIFFHIRAPLDLVNGGFG